MTTDARASALCRHETTTIFDAWSDLLRAAVHRAHGDPDVVRIEEVQPTAGPGEVSIEVCAAALNPKDALLR